MSLESPGMSCFAKAAGPDIWIPAVPPLRPRREFSAEFKVDAVRVVTERGKPSAQVESELA